METWLFNVLWLGTVAALYKLLFKGFDDFLECCWVSCSGLWRRIPFQEHFPRAFYFMIFFFAVVIPPVLFFIPFEENQVLKEPIFKEQSGISNQIGTVQLMSELENIWISNADFTNEDFDIVFSFLIRAASERSTLPTLIPYDLRINLPPDLKISIDHGPDTVKFTKLLDIMCSQARMTWNVDKGVIVFESSEK